MAFPTIPGLPPSSENDEDFEDRADDWVQFQYDLAVWIQANEAALIGAADAADLAQAAANAAAQIPTYGGTSTSTINTASGSAQGITTQSGKGFAASDKVMLMRRSDVSIRALATVNSYSGTSLNLTIDLTTVTGTPGSYSDWYVVAGPLAGPLMATAADIWAGTSATKVVPAKAWADSLVPQTLNPASPIAWPMLQGSNAEVTITANSTLATPTGAVLGGIYNLDVIQGDANTRLMTWPSAIQWGRKGAPLLSTGLNKRDQIVLKCVKLSPLTFTGSYDLGFG